MALFFNLSDLGLPTSSAQALQTWLTQMQTQFPGYNPSAGDLEYIQAQIFASFFADLGQATATGSQELFRTFGTDLVGLSFQNGSPASAIVTVTAVDTAGYTLPSGTQLSLTLNGVQLGFQTIADLTIAPGSSSGNVTVDAVQSGIAFNGAGSPAQLISQINWVTGVAVVAAASGGADQEDDSRYLQRLAGTLQLLAQRPITANDYATMALNFTPTPGTDQQQVGRATAIDGYDPGTNTFGNQREITVVITDATGQPLNSDTITAVAAWFQTLREVSFIVNVQSPAYTTVYVACQVHGVSSFTSSTVKANVQSAILNFLSPATWGLPPSAEVGWTNYTTVFRSRLTAAIQNAAGVDFIQNLAIDVNSNPTNTTNDLLLPGPVPMPVTTTVSVPLTGITIV